MDFLGRGFKAAKCKTLLRLAISRIKLLRNKREIQIKSMRKDIANLLQTGQEPSARIRIEHVVREQNVLAAYEIIELFAELIVVRLPIIESQRQCPLDLKEAIASLIFAAPRCSDLPELQDVRGLFGVKYGKDFVVSAAELRPDCGVNRRIIEKLSARAPPGDVKLKLLKEIAQEHNVEWDPSQSEAELLKQHEDLLDGPSQFISATQRQDILAAGQRSSQRITMESMEPPVKDFPSVPSQNIRSEDEPEPAAKPSSVIPPKQTVRTPSPPPPVTPPQRNLDNERQYIPFVAPPPPEVRAPTQIDQTPEEKMEYKDVAAAAQAAAESAERAAAAARAAASLAKGTSFTAASMKSRQYDSDSESEEEVVSQPTSSVPFQPTAPPKPTEVSSSESEEEEESHVTLPKPMGKPHFDGEDEYYEPRWSSRFKEGKPSLSPQQSFNYDEDGIRTKSNVTTGMFDRAQFDTPSFDEPEEVIKPSFKWQSSLPPRRAPPEVPKYSHEVPKFPSESQKVSRSDSPESSLFRSDSNMYRSDSNEYPKASISRADSDSSTSSGHSVHPKLPDYDDLTARFQALKSRR